MPSVAVSAGAQPPVGALALDENQGDQYGWAINSETAAAARGAALCECGPGCSVVLTFGRSAAYAADQDLDARRWAGRNRRARRSRPGRRRCLECDSRGGGSGRIVRVWG